jgi:hypothetical protein
LNRATDGEKRRARLFRYDECVDEYFLRDMLQSSDAWIKRVWAAS